MPASTASVARCTSTGFVSSEAPPRFTASDSTSSSSTTIGFPREARSGSVRSKSRATARWLSPRSWLGNACGLTSTASTVPRASRGSASRPRSALEVIGPHDAGEIGRVELGQLLEEVQRVEQDADHVVQRVEVVHADEARGAVLRAVEVLVPGPVVDDDEVALGPLEALAVHLAVPVARHDVEPRLAAMAVTRLVQAR